MNSNNRIVATLFPRDTVCLRNISINTLHKGDDDDDDDDDNNNNNNNNKSTDPFVMAVIPPYAAVSYSVLSLYPFWFDWLSPLSKLQTLPHL